MRAHAAKPAAFPRRWPTTLGVWQWAAIEAWTTTPCRAGSGARAPWRAGAVAQKDPTNRCAYFVRLSDIDVAEAAFIFEQIEEILGRRCP